jgi:hypothetical protein
MLGLLESEEEMVEFLFSLFATIVVVGFGISMAMLPILVVFSIWEEVKRGKENK